MRGIKNTSGRAVRRKSAPRQDASRHTVVDYFSITAHRAAVFPPE